MSAAGSSSVNIFVFARLHARPGKRDEVRQAMFEIQGPTRIEPGCLSYGAFHSVRDPDEFYIHTRWLDMAAFERHVELPHTVRFVEAVEPLLDHPLKVTLSEQLWQPARDRTTTAIRHAESSDIPTLVEVTSGEKRSRFVRPLS